MKLTKNDKRLRIKKRIRKSINGTSERPRLAVYRSNKEIYAQVIDDLSGKTLFAANSVNNEEAHKGNKVEQAKVVGKQIAEQAKAAGVSSVVFDRSGYLYHGRIKSLADAAREAGLNF